MDDILKYIKDNVLESFLQFISQVIDNIPQFIGGLILIILGLLISKIVAYIVKRFLIIVKFDSLFAKLSVQELLNSASIQLPPSSIVSKTIFYILFFFFLVPAFNQMGLSLISEALTNFIFWIPNLIVALAIFLLGYTIAGFIRNLIKTAAASFGASAGQLMGNIVFYFLLIIITITAVNQAGIDTEIINSNLSLAIGGIILAFAIAYGFASKDLLASIISSFYNRKKYSIGQKIRIGNLEGTIKEIDSVSIILKNDQGSTVIPLSKMLTENVQILG